MLDVVYYVSAVQFVMLDVVYYVYPQVTDVLVIYQLIKADNK